MNIAVILGIEKWLLPSQDSPLKNYIKIELNNAKIMSI